MRWWNNKPIFASTSSEPRQQAKAARKQQWKETDQQKLAKAFRQQIKCFLSTSLRRHNKTERKTRLKIIWSRSGTVASGWGASISVLYCFSLTKLQPLDTCRIYGCVVIRKSVFLGWWGFRAVVKGSEHWFIGDVRNVILMPNGRFWWSQYIRISLKLDNIESSFKKIDYFPRT